MSLTSGLCRVALVLGVALSGLAGERAHAAEAPSVCRALVADAVDPAEVRAALKANPESVDDICKVRRSALGEGGLTTLFVLSGLAILPGVLDQAKYARHTTLQMAILRDSAPAARALVSAGANPTGSHQGASALTLAVLRDLDAGNTTWTDLSLRLWQGPIPDHAVSSEALDRLFFAPELEGVLRSKGMRRHGLAEDGTTWLHRALLQDWPMPARDDVLIRDSIDGVEARNGELPRYEETTAIGARWFEETSPRLTFAAVMARGVPVGIKDAGGRTPLYYAAYTGNWVAYDRLVKEGARPWEAGAQPESILFALAAGGSVERFEKVLRTLLRRGVVDVEDLDALAGSLLYSEPSGWCRESEAIRPRGVRCDELPDQVQTRRLLAATGASPSRSWWKARVDQQARISLQGAVEVGFVPPVFAVKMAVRRKDWKTTRMLVRYAEPSAAQARRLGWMAARRGAPKQTRATIDTARARAEGPR